MEQSAEAKRDYSDLIGLLKRLKTEVYYDEPEALAEGLGRTTEEIKAWFDGAEIDEDGEMKIQELAQERLDEK